MPQTDTLQIAQPDTQLGSVLFQRADSTVWPAMVPQETETAANLPAAPVVSAPVADAASQLFLSKPHALKLEAQEPLRRPSDPGWVFIVLCGVILVIGYLRWSLVRRFDSFLRGLIDSNIATQIYREDNSVSQRLTALFMVGGLVDLALLMGYWIDGRAISNESAGTVSLIAFVVIGMGLFLKTSVHGLLGWVFGAERSFDQHNFNHMLFFGSLAPILTPLVGLVYFGPAAVASTCMVMAVGVTVLSYLMLQWRGAILFMAIPGVSPLHAFYYLCALEITPLAVSFRLSSQFI